MGHGKRHLWREAVVALPYGDAVLGLLSPKAGLGTVWTEAALETPVLWQ